MKKWLIKRLRDLHWGQFLWSKISFIITIAIFVGVYKFNTLVKIIIMIIAIIGAFGGGNIFNKYLRKDFQKELYKDTLIKKENETI